MKTGIIGLPQVGKTSLFRILTKAHCPQSAYANPREAHIGVAKVPDDRLDKLAALYNPKKLTHTSVEYVDVGAIGQEALKETAYIGHLRQVDALAHVVRAFEDPCDPACWRIDPLRDIKNVEFDLMVSDLGQIEKRLERLEKDLKKMKTPELEKEFELLKRANAHLGSEKPLREMEMTPEDKKRIRGFMFLSEKPIFYVLNIGESHATRQGTRRGRRQVQADRDCRASECRGHRDLRQGRSRTRRDERRRRRRISFQLRSDRERTRPPDSHDLQTARPDFILHRRRRRMPRLAGSRAKSRAQEAAGAIHSDLEKHFIRAETIRWDQLLEAGSEANARAKGTLRLEGKDYIVQDGDVMHIRHSG